MIINIAPCIDFSTGGFQEATLYTRGHHKIFLKSRKGFIKYALQFGYKVEYCSYTC